MFLELQNQIWTPGDGVTVSDNTDFTIDGTSKKIVFADAQDKTVTISFDEVDLSSYEELVFHAYIGKELGIEDNEYLSIEIDGHDIDMSFAGQVNNQYMLFIFDCTQFGAVSSITLTCLTDDLVMFIDLMGVRKVETDSMDEDVLEAMAKAINLDYGVTTTLRTAAPAGGRNIALTSRKYMYEDTQLTISEGENSEHIETDGFTDESARLKKALQHSYTTAAVVEAKCPVRWGRHNRIRHNPVVGIIIVDRTVDKVDCFEAGKTKVMLGSLLINVYIECSSEEKVLSLSRQFEKQHGDRLSFILDGQCVEAYLEDYNYIGPEMKGFPRQVYTYEFAPQPVTESRRVAITDINIEMESKDANNNNE